MSLTYKRKHHVIYKTTCKVTGKWYIGMHSTDNLDDGYLGSGTHLCRSAAKYGKDNHVYEVLEHLPNRQALCEREKEIVNGDVIRDPMCMNMMVGGFGNYPGKSLPEEARKKVSEGLKKTWAKRLAEGYKPPQQSPEQIADRAAKNTGKKRSEETKQRMKEAQRLTQERLAADSDYKEKVSKTISDSLNSRSTEAKELQRQRMSEAAKQRAPMSAETRAKIALSNKAKAGKKRSPEACERMRIAALNRKKPLHAYITL